MRPREAINIRVPMLLVALLASLSVHWPVYEGLGFLRDYFEAHALKESQPREPVEIEFTPTDDPPAEPRATQKTQSPPPPPSVPKPEPAPVEAVKELKQKPPTETLERQAIEQRSPDPSVETPKDAQFIASENRKVEKESVARIRNYLRDDPVARLSERRHGPEEEAGDSEEQDTQDLKDRKGSPTQTSSTDERVKRMHDPASRERVARTSPAEASPAKGETPLESPDGEVEVARKSAAEQSIGQRPDLRVSWRAFERTFGEDQLASEYKAFAEMRRSKSRGSNRQKEWKEFRSAIENFVPNVQPGNQTALNAAASPFASYLAAVHRRLHREFADRFLANLPAGEPLFNDENLRTKLEVILNRDGSVYRVGVVETSGFMPYDYGAFAAVMRGQPYPSAPGSILSGDGRVYLHWAFYRNERQCGTFNAEPYILPHPPGAPTRSPGALRDSLEWGGIIPGSAHPAGTGQVAPASGTPSDVQPSSAPPPSKKNGSPKTPDKTRSAPQKFINGSAVG